MKHTEIDTAHVLHSYGLALAEKQSRTCDEGHLPFPKDVIKSAIAHYVRQEQDDQVVRHLEFAYRQCIAASSIGEGARISPPPRNAPRILGWVVDPTIPTDSEKRVRA